MQLSIFEIVAADFVLTSKKNVIFLMLIKILNVKMRYGIIINIIKKKKSNENYLFLRN